MRWWELLTMCCFLICMFSWVQARVTSFFQYEGWLLIRSNHCSGCCLGSFKMEALLNWSHIHIMSSSMTCVHCLSAHRRCQMSGTPLRRRTERYRNLDLRRRVVGVGRDDDAMISWSIMWAAGFILSNRRYSRMIAASNLRMVRRSPAIHESEPYSTLVSTKVLKISWRFCSSMRSLWYSRRRCWLKAPCPIANRCATSRAWSLVWCRAPPKWRYSLTSEMVCICLSQITVNVPAACGP